MARFVFSLEQLLQQRRRQEQQAQRALADCQSAAAGQQAALERLGADLASARDSLRGELTGAVNVAYLSIHQQYTLDAATRTAELNQRLAAAQRRVREAEAALIHAAKQRRVVEVLREKQLADWRARQSRRDQAEADEVAMQMGLPGPAAANG